MAAVVTLDLSNREMNRSCNGSMVLGMGQFL